MSLLQRDTETTTLLQVIQDAEHSMHDHFDVMHLSLDNCRELILVAITGDNLDSMGQILEGLRDIREA